MKPSISVVIRNRNEAKLLERALRALAMQHHRPDEIIIVDNGSTDGSLEVARSFGAHIVAIAQEDFTYGRALNRGIEQATGDLIMLLSAHSLPIGRFFVEAAIEPFVDERVAGVRCIMVSKRQEIEAWMQGRVLEWPVEIAAVIKQGPIASGCVIRRSVWEKVRFDESLEAVEDKFWALEALKLGYLISSCEAVYLHMRKRGLWERARIVNREQLAFFRTTGKRWLEPEATFPKLVKAVFLYAPYAAASVIAGAAAEYVYQRTIPVQARRKPRAGSIQ